jgi:hypothetical protein
MEPLSLAGDQNSHPLITEDAVIVDQMEEQMQADAVLAEKTRAKYRSVTILRSIADSIQEDIRKRDETGKDKDQEIEMLHNHLATAYGLIKDCLRFASRNGVSTPGYLDLVYKVTNARKEMIDLMPDTCVRCFMKFQNNKVKLKCGHCLCRDCYPVNQRPIICSYCNIVNGEP